MGEGSELETQLPRMFPYRRDDPLGLRDRLFIREPEHRPSKVFQFNLPEVVPQHNVVALVNPAVDLEDQPEPVAGEVGDVWAYGVLAAEAVAVDPRGAELLPQPALRQTGGLTLCAREGCAAAGHDAIMTCFREPVSFPLPPGEGP